MLLLLILCAYLFLLSPFGQNWLTQKVVGYLSAEWNTKIELKKARFALFNRIRLESLTVYDSKQDTLLNTDLLEARITNWFFLRDKNYLGPIRLDNALVQLQRDDSTWQHDALLKQLQGPKTNSSSGGGGSSFYLRDLEINGARFILRDGWTGMDLSASLEKLVLNADRLSANDSVFDIRLLSLTKPHVSIEE